MDFHFDLFLFYQIPFITQTKLIRSFVLISVFILIRLIECVFVNIIFGKFRLCFCKYHLWKIQIRKFQQFFKVFLLIDTTGKQTTVKKVRFSPGADLGGGGGRPSSPQGFDPLPTERVPPSILFQKSIFGRPTLKFSKGALGANIY